MSENIAPGPPPTPSPPRARGGRDEDGPVCPSCGAKRITSAAVPCWLCAEMLPPLDVPVPAGAVRGREENPVFIMAGVLIVLLAVGLALSAPGMILVLAVAATPALIRSAVVTSQARRAGVPLSGAERIGAFLGALGSVVLVGAAAGVAFFATCFAVCLGILAVGSRGDEGLILPLSVFAGLVPAIFILVWLFRRVWGRGRS
jgi:hypothetical protein